MSRNYEHPGGAHGAWLANLLANSRWLRTMRRRMSAWLPFPVLESDVRDVLYLSWAVPMPLARSVLPHGITLMESDGQTVLTILIYRHGNFGPRLLGPFRRFLPSPLQSNWRFYVANIYQSPVVAPTVLFIRNFFDSALYAIGSRIGSDALPSELPLHFTYSTGQGFRSRITDGTGQLQLEVAAAISDEKRLPEELTALYSSWDEAVARLTLQDVAIVQPPDLDHLAQAGISLPIDVTTVRPAEADVICGPWLTQLGVSGRPLAFVVPSVKFMVLWERILASTANPSMPEPPRNPA